MIYAFGLAQSKGAGHFLEEIARCLLQCLGRLQLLAAHLPAYQRQQQKVQVGGGLVFMHNCRQQIFTAVARSSPIDSRSKERIFCHTGIRRQAHQQFDGLDVIAAQFVRVNTSSGQRAARQGGNFGRRVRAVQDDVLSRATGVDMGARATLVLVSAQVVRSGLCQC